MSMAVISVHIDSGGLCWRLPVCRTELAATLGRMTEAAVVLKQAPPTVSLELRLLRDAEIAVLNLRHMGCSGPTNILSFPAGEGASLLGEAPPGTDVPSVALGSLALNVDAVRREALLYGQEPGEHCFRLLAHGLAHLCGHDHGAAMDALCDAMLAAL